MKMKIRCCHLNNGSIFTVIIENKDKFVIYAYFIPAINSVLLYLKF